MFKIATWIVLKQDIFHTTKLHEHCRNPGKFFSLKKNLKWNSCEAENECVSPDEPLYAPPHSPQSCSLNHTVTDGSVLMSPLL